MQCACMLTGCTEKMVACAPMQHSPETMDVEMRKIMSYGSGGDGTSERAAEKKLLQVR